MCQDATIDRRQDIISRKNNKSEIIPGIKKRKDLYWKEAKVRAWSCSANKRDMLVNF